MVVQKNTELGNRGERQDQCAQQEQDRQLLFMLTRLLSSPRSDDFGSSRDALVRAVELLGSQSALAAGIEEYFKANPHKRPKNNKRPVRQQYIGRWLRTGIPALGYAEAIQWATKNRVSKDALYPASW